MAWMEEMVSLMNAYPPLWFLYVLVIILPFVLIISYFLWPKTRDDVAYRKKTDVSTPDDKHKEVVRDSGIEASGEADQESERGISPSTLETMSQVKHKGTNKKQVEEPHSSTGGIQNGVVEIVDAHKGKEKKREEESDGQEEEKKRWSFPPILEEFDLMATEKDPMELEDIFSDTRLKAVKFRIERDGPGLGITIVGGSNSPNGDLPLLIKRVIPGSLADKEGTIQSGDELVAVNETLLTGVEKSYAVKALSNLEGDVRLLILQDD